MIRRAARVARSRSASSWLAFPPQRVSSVLTARPSSVPDSCRLFSTDGAKKSSSDGDGGDDSSSPSKGEELATSPESKPETGAEGKQEAGDATGASEDGKVESEADEAAVEHDIADRMTEVRLSTDSSNHDALIVECASSRKHLWH